MSTNGQAYYHDWRAWRFFIFGRLPW